ncbi:hypothetical protein [Actinokineospora terrae]|uniref:Uncharacterized protein n=1 Tax=Actinokineospora terrae TaxID=155974 RepID=A0A1H9S2C7_9PSEU|nr:hypothetical protein [Actinokineospora terrae]SER78503.1 hypothetical protein SAMN04487818_105211 [Actinokineospora terrae]
MLDDTDPAVRAIRAPFQQLSAALADELARSRATYEQDLATPEQRPRKRRSHLEDPTDTGVFTVSWMTNRG